MSGKKKIFGKFFKVRTPKIEKFSKSQKKFFFKVPRRKMIDDALHSLHICRERWFRHGGTGDAARKAIQARRSSAFFSMHRGLSSSWRRLCSEAKQSKQAATALTAVQKRTPVARVLCLHSIGSRFCPRGLAPCDRTGKTVSDGKEIDAIAGRTS